MTAPTSSPGATVAAWAARDADLYVVIGRGASELRDCLRDRPRERGAVVLHIEPDADPVRVAQAIDDLVRTPGFAPRRITCAVHPAEVDAHGPPVLALADAIGAAAQRWLVSVNTFAMHARAFLWHTLRNVAWYPGSVDLASLTGAATGMPGIVVAAGPSLSQSLEAIRRAAPRAVVLACDTAMPALIGAGIDADVIASIDLQPHKARVVRWLNGRSLALMAMQQFTHPRIVSAWHGPRVWLGTPSAATRLIPPVEPVDETLSVAHAAFAVARRLGCSPIALTGLDLAFTDGTRTHAANTFAHWGEHADRPAPDCLVHGLDGERWPSLSSMAAMRTAFETQIAATDVPVWNATARGAHIRGAERRALDELPRDTTARPDLTGRPLAMDVDATQRALLAAVDNPPRDLVMQAAFEPLFRTRQLSAADEKDARRFATRCCHLVARRLQRRAAVAA